jgi:hypothetical protein
LIDGRDTNDDDDDEGEDKEDSLLQDKKRIQRAIKEFEKRGNNYFKHCNKEKIETLRAWSDKVVEDGDVMVKELGSSVDSQTVKDNLMPMAKYVRFFNSPRVPLHKQRKLLQKVQFGKGIMHAIKTIALPYINLILKKTPKRLR